MNVQIISFLSFITYENSGKLYPSRSNTIKKIMNKS